MTFKRYLSTFKFFICIGLLTLIFCFLSGCKKKENTPANAETHVTYGKQVSKITIPGTKGYTPFSFKLSDNYLYYEGIHDEEEQATIFYRTSVSECEEPEFFCKINSDIGVIYSVASEGNKDYIYALSFTLGTFHLTKINNNGEVISDVTVTDGRLSSDIPFEMCTDGEKFVCISSNCMFVIDSKGNILNAAQCPDGEFENVILCNGKPVLFCKDKFDKYYSVTYDSKLGKFTDKCENQCSGICGTSKDSDVLLTYPEAIVFFDIENGECTQIVEYEKFGLSFSKIQYMYCVGEDILIVYGNKIYDGASVKLIVLNAGGTFEETRTRVNIYFPSGKGTFNERYVDDFNEISEKYYVEVLDNDKPYDAVFSSDKVPDVIFESEPNMIDDYIRLGYLEDLSSYLSNSSTLNINDVSQYVFDCYGRGEALYAIPEKLAVRTMLVTERAVQNDSGWTVGEYLEWLSKHPEICSISGMTKKNILKDCVYGCLEYFADTQSGTASFDSPLFVNILKQISELAVSDKTEPVVIKAGLEVDGTPSKMLYLYNANLNGLADISELNYCLNDAMIYKGLPSITGEKKTIFTTYSNYAIFCNSRNKQGAFEFIEYVIAQTFDNLVAGITNKGAQWSLDSFSSAAMENCIAEKEIKSVVSYPVALKDSDLFREIVDDGVYITSEMQKIIDIIMEETEPLFLSQKSAEEVSKIIQSRVSILLSERR